MAELKKIEMRKKEREKKQQDLQKLISAAEQNTDSKKSSLKKSFSSSIKKLKGSSLNPTQPKVTEGGREGEGTPYTCIVNVLCLDGKFGCVQIL